MPIIMSSDADITATSIKYFGWALFTFAIFGAIYDLKRYIRGLLPSIYLQIVSRYHYSLMAVMYQKSLPTNSDCML